MAPSFRTHVPLRLEGSDKMVKLTLKKNVDDGGLVLGYETIQLAFNAGRFPVGAEWSPVELCGYDREAYEIRVEN